eukprot:m.982 g.982  ORF g.982 m.982 type:complete len:51 (+) comp653_c0_seq1:129-281(+)
MLFMINSTSNNSRMLKVVENQWTYQADRERPIRASTASAFSGAEQTFTEN